MTRVQEHDYPGTQLSWRRELTDEGVDRLGSLVRAALEILSPLVRIYEVEAAITHTTGQQHILRTELPSGVGERVWRGSEVRVHETHLVPARVAGWLVDLCGPVFEGLELLELQTGSLAARVPRRPGWSYGTDYQVGGEIYFLRYLNLEGAEWLAGPITDVGSSAPIEISLGLERGCLSLDVHLLCDAWEFDDDQLDPDLEACFEALEAAGWQRDEVDDEDDDDDAP